MYEKVGDCRGILAVVVDIVVCHGVEMERIICVITGSHATCALGEIM